MSMETTCNEIRPVPNVVLLSCRSEIKLSFRFKHGSSTPFETIKGGTAELGSAELLSPAGLAVQHGSSTTWFQTACYCRTELNLQINLMCLALFAHYYACAQIKNRGTKWRLIVKIYPICPRKLERRGI